MARGSIVAAVRPTPGKVAVLACVAAFVWAVAAVELFIVASN